MPDTSLRNALALPLSTDGGNTFYTGLHSSLETIDAAIAKCTDAKALDPSVDDDEDEGYATRSICVTVGHKIFMCEDPATGEAVWRQLWPPLPEALAVTNAMLAGSISNDKLAGSIDDAKLAASYLKADGSRGLSAAWDAGSFQIRAETFQSDVATGTAPLAVASTTKVSNLNADLLDDIEAAAFMVKSLIDAKGDLIAGSADNTPARVAVGTDGQSLIADSTQAAGIVWDSSRLTGWIPAPALTYAASDAPSYTVTIAGDYSAIITPGMRIKLTDSTVKYFIVTKSEYSSPNTTLTLYGGTDYTLSGGAISSPYYSMMKAPVGFPLDVSKWVVVFSTTSNGLTGSPTTQSQWYNLHSLVVPIGLWRIRYNAAAYPQSAGEMFATLSKANNTEDDKEFSCRVYFAGHAGIFAVPISAEKIVNLAAKTTYYLNAMSNTTTQQIGFAGAEQSTIIKAYCAYL